MDAGQSPASFCSLHALTLIVIVTAGCIEGAAPDELGRLPPPADCSDQPCLVESQAHLSNPSTSDSEIDLANCNQVDHTLEVRNEVWNPNYPPSVKPATTLNTPVQVAELVFWTCAQAVVAGKIEHGMQLLLFTGAIEPPLPESGNDTFSRFIFQAYTNSPEMQRRITNQLGVNVSIVPTIAVSEEVISTMPEPSVHYQFEAGPGTTWDYSVQGHLRKKSVAAVATVESYYSVDAAGQLRAFSILWEGVVGPSSAAVVEFGPGAYWATNGGPTHWPAVNVWMEGISGNVTWIGRDTA